QERLQFLGKVGLAAQLDSWRHLALDRRLPTLERTPVNGSIIGEGFVRDLGHNAAVFENAHFVVAGDAPYYHSIESPLGKDALHFIFPATLGHQKHALL